jgi:hypothetical protein
VDDISVEILAKIDQLQSGLDQAVSLVKGASDEMKGGMENTSNAGEKMDGLLKGVLSGAAFLEFKEIATEALHAVQEGLEMTAEKAMEFGLSNAKFAAMMGTSSEQAAGLSAALKAVGVSAEQYESMAMRMEMRLKTNEKALNSYGMATRDASGNLLQGTDLMNSAISTMEQYKSGTDQNEFALQVFGRRASDVYDIMRVSKAAQEQYTQDMKELGVQVGDTSRQSSDYEEAQARMKQKFEDIFIAIGQKLMPVMTQFFDDLNEDTGAFKDIEIAVEGFVEALAFVKLLIMSLGHLIGGFVAEALVGFAGIASAVADGLSGNLSQAKSDLTQTTSKMADVFHNTMVMMAGDAQNFVDTTKALFGSGLKPDDKGVYDSGGEKKFKAYDPKAGQEAQKLADEKLQAAEREALEEKKIEEDKNNFLLQQGEQTLEEYLAKAKQIETDKYNIQRDYLEKKAMEDRKNVVEYQKDQDEIKLLDETHQEAMNKIDQQGAEKRLALQRQETQDFITNKENELSKDMNSVEEQYKAHQISADERAALEKQLTQKIEQEILARLDAENSALKKGTDAYNNYMKQREQLVQKFASDSQKIENTLAQEEQQKWTTLTNTIRSSFNSALNGMILGSENWKQALGNIINSVAESFLQMGEKILEDWIQTQIEKAIMTETTQQTTQAATVLSNAEIAASGAMASISAIPYIGPFMAPGVAAATFGETMAFAEQGMVLDRDRLVFGHKEEMVLPAPLSRGIAGLINQGGMGDTHLHYGPTVNAPEHKSLSQMLVDESSTMLAWVNARMRDGSLKARA